MEMAEPSHDWVRKSFYCSSAESFLGQRAPEVDFVYKLLIYWSLSLLSGIMFGPKGSIVKELWGPNNQPNPIVFMGFWWPHAITKFTFVYFCMAGYGCCNTPIL